MYIQSVFADYIFLWYHQFILARCRKVRQSREGGNWSFVYFSLGVHSHSVDDNNYTVQYKSQTSVNGIK